MSNWFQERLKNLRLTVKEIEIPLSAGDRKHVEKAIGLIEEIANNDCHDCPTTKENCDCGPCNAKRAIRELIAAIDVPNDTLHPDRLGNLCEAIYLEQWRKLNARDFRSQNGLTTLELILSPTRRTPKLFRCAGDPPEVVPPVTRRDAQVAATLMQWLGTACGGGFVRRCEDEIKSTKAIRDEFMLGLTSIGTPFDPATAAAHEIASEICPTDHEEFEPLVKKLAIAITNAAKCICPG